MGRRSINTTKSGKYMNPTDQARKEARKRELKKNKKQRMLVRTAVLKGKDPHQVLADMERLDQMEYNVDAPPPLNEKVLRDKRRKLKETWDRLCRLYAKEDHDKFLELKRLEGEYEAKRNKMIKFYDAVKSTQDVALDEIPLPSEPPQPDSLLSGEMFQASSTTGQEPASILKKGQINLTEKEPPGLPPGLPPNIDDWEDGNSEDDDDEKIKKVRFGENEKESDISEFLKEIEDVERDATENNGSANEESKNKETQESERNQDTENSFQPATTSSTVTPTLTTPITSLGPAKIQPAPPSGPPPPVLLIPPTIQPPPLIPSQMRPGIVPPGGGPARPGMMVPNQQFRPPMGPHIGPQPRPTHPRPSHLNRSQQHRKDDKKQSQNFADKATIEAKPQLRNLSADATRFTPLALRVRRPEKVVKKPTKGEGYEENYAFTSTKPTTTTYKEESKSAPTKDDAYEEFMKELKNII